jgi:hypothetical protein
LHSFANINDDFVGLCSTVLKSSTTRVLGAAVPFSPGKSASQIRASSQNTREFLQFALSVILQRMMMMLLRMMILRMMMMLTRVGKIVGSLKHLP